jgi:hypothetical protein
MYLPDQLTNYAKYTAGGNVCQVGLSHISCTNKKGRAKSKARPYCYLFTVYSKLFQL